MSLGLPTALGRSGRTSNSGKKRITSFAFLCGIFMLMAAGNAKAQIATDGFEGVVVSGSTANSGGATGDPGLGIAASSWTSTGTFTTFTGTAPTAPTALSLSNSSAASQTWTWTIPVGCSQASINQISFNYRSTGTSYNQVIVRVNGTPVYVNAGLITNSAFQSVNTSFSAVNVTTPIAVSFEFSGGTHGSGGTFRLDNVKLFGSVSAGSSTCTGAPVAGTVSAAASSFCASGATTISLAGATEGCGITHKWQKSTTSATTGFADVAGTGSSLSTGTITSTTYYRSYTVCSNSGLADTSAATTVTINTPPVVGAITGLPAGPLVVGNATPLGNSTSGGFWSSSNTSVATVDASGIVTPVAGGNTVISYLVVGTGGCNATATAAVNVVWPNTLALYAGTDGNSTNVIVVPDETSSPLTVSSGFTTTTPCSSGGFSGLTVPTTVTSYSAAGPHVFYTIKPAPGFALNVTRIAAAVRVTGSGPTRAKIAYSRDGITWFADSAKTLDRTGSCGTSPNRWSFGDPGMNGDVTINGITDSLMVAVYPYGATATGSNFQLNSLEVYGKVTDDIPCSELSNAGAVTPVRVNICDSGSRWLNYDFVNGASGVGISYQWQKYNTATTNWDDIPTATNASYNTGKLYAPATNYYRVKVLCNGGAGGTNFSAPDTVTVNAIPSASFVLPASPFYLQIGTPVNLPAVATASPAGGWWSSNDTSSTSVDSASGLATGHIPGISVITYHVTNGGCTGVARDTINAIWPNTMAVYLGKNGNSTNVVTSPDVSASPFTNFGYAAATPCSKGGLSGLTNNGVTAYSASGARASFTLTAANPVDVTGFHATVRRSNSGIQNVRLAYNLNNLGWTDDGVDQDVDADDCGYSVNDLAFSGSLPVSLNPGDVIEFGVFGYNPVANGGTLQINTIDITGNGVPVMKQAPSAVGNVSANSIQLYPNPATSTLNIAAAENVNVEVVALDGKTLISQNNAKQINVSALANGLYIIKVYNENNNLIKTAKFNKQ